MKKLIDSIQEKLVITKDTKEKNYPEFYLVWPKRIFHELFIKYEDAALYSKHNSSMPPMLILQKDNLKTIDEDDIKTSEVVVYDVSEKYNDIDKFTEDYNYGKIGWEEIKKFPILTLKDIKNL